jgi:outer membrane lipoprotein-sorting protein
MVLVAACLVVFACGRTLAQTAEELVNKNIQARGGLEKIKSAKTRLTTGRLKAGRRRNATFKQMNMRPNLFRQNLSMQGMTAVQAYDGSVGWQTNPFRGRKDPELMGEDNLRDLLLAADFDGPLVDYAEKGNKIEFLGHDAVDGDDALRLKVTLKNGDIIYYFLDPDTYLEIRKEIQQFVRGSVRERVVDLGSYKPVDGVMYPFSISEGPRNNPGAQMTTVQRIEVNVAFQESDFALPASLRTEEKKSGLVGVH